MSLGGRIERRHRDTNRRIPRVVHPLSAWWHELEAVVGREAIIFTIDAVMASLASQARFARAFGLGTRV